MRRFDVFYSDQDDMLLLNVQADLLNQLDTAVAVPLLPREQGRELMSVLNPEFEINSRVYVMQTQLLSALNKSEFGKHVCSLKADHREISNALDLLLVGF